MGDVNSPSTTYHSLWDTAEAVLTGKFIATRSPYIKIPNRSQPENLVMLLRVLKNRVMPNPHAVTARNGKY